MKFRDLPADQKLRAARFVRAGMMALVRTVGGGGSYEAVDAPTSRQRKPAFVELTGEDGILPAYKRGKLTDLSRQAMRNGPERRTMNQQRRVNIVGTLGGKLTCNFDGGEDVARWFNTRWAPHAGFTSDTHFNEILKLVVQAVDTDGDCVLLFDDGFITGGVGTGRIRAFPTDEIADLEEKDFKALVGEDHTQTQGVVFDSLGAFAGVIVSTSQRGRQKFTAKDGAAWFLTRDPFARDRSENWIFCAARTFFGQARGISPLVAAINTITDIHEIAASETQSAKINSQLVGQLISDAKDDIDTGSVPDAFSQVLADAATAAEGELQKENANGETVEFTLEEMDAIGAHIDEMPAGKRLELLDTKRPNPNMAAYLDWLVGHAAGTLGMPRLYAMLKADNSYSSARAEMCLAWATFEECQKTLERTVCDWAARQAIAWAVRTGELKAPPDGWESLLSWSWPKAREIDEQKSVAATRAKLQLGLTTYRRELGPDYQATLKEWADEVAQFKALGIPHPAMQTVAGAPIETEPSEPTGDKQDEDSQA